MVVRPHCESNPARGVEAADKRYRAHADAPIDEERRRFEFSLKSAAREPVRRTMAESEWSRHWARCIDND